ncbi:methylated-DNA--[protein]-cysteine S-methyltransferase [Phycicoccus sp. MAQZ13P-2]|uniref:methylated-DNA--[protein]-cysteine S-methyltransferase n=1 Tax=Phycicoccus mangrovi TaxID=2840470 RepID=UPI001C0030EC|nr:methylated-DNA--[protein]-cysteine S-methyltransferase [Phycicoccus mangrovi]MBT9254121.1 methylated-DNA--[protein]-cysteine S-methyltransferase [Phycicoccus mangrovi]MBT9272500.1 methylated-DNA--[protein]-cysteine S-methyltransferase [Phycicoccus mangrovi]
MPADAGTASLVVGSPVGALELVADGDALVAIRFDAEGPLDDEVLGAHPVLVAARRQLAEYFAGERTVFDLPLRPEGTEFRRRVWRELALVPWGRTTTYGALAARLGLPPGASRAVGAANGANPLPVVLPCHRVVGSDGTLTGYAGGLERKAFLLHLEGVATEADQGSLFGP